MKKQQLLLIGGVAVVGFLMYRNAQAQAAATSTQPALPAPDPNAGAAAPSSDPSTSGNSGAAFMGAGYGVSPPSYRRLARRHPAQFQNFGARPRYYAKKHPGRASRYGDPYAGGGAMYPDGGSYDPGAYDPSYGGDYGGGGDGSDLL